MGWAEGGVSGGQGEGPLSAVLLSADAPPSPELDCLDVPLYYCDHEWEAAAALEAVR